MERLETNRTSPRRLNMKTMNRILFTATLAVTAALLSQTKVQAQSTDDGIAASPKVRAMLNERKAAAAAPVDVPTAVAATPAKTQPAQLAASPRLRQALDDRKMVSGVADEPSTVVSYASGGRREIAASPKLREQLEGRQMEFQIAPVK
jgi:hypothetical protein